MKKDKELHSLELAAMNRCLSLMKALILLLLMAGVSSVSTDEHAAAVIQQEEADLDLVVVAYYSGAYARDEHEEPLLFRSIADHHETYEEGKQVKVISVGKGAHLWTHGHFNETEETRGWMWRFRLVIQALKEEYDRRNGEDFLALLGDAQDVYVTKSVDSNTMDLLKTRFLTEFAAKDYSIVFSAQVYCCNPWNLRDVARKGWDTFYDSRIIENFYKHLNAGIFMGYTSTILDMAGEMGAFEKAYKPLEHFDNFERGNITMGDLNVDDDEWQLAVWYMKEHETNKVNPRAILDINHELFSTTGTWRASNRNGGFLLWSENDFMDMFGPLPESEQSLRQIASQCPYEFDTTRKQWKNTVTQSYPLIFHFAGHEWLCACQIFEGEGYQTIPSKFADQCINDYPHWKSVVNEAISSMSDPDKQVFLRGNFIGRLSRELQYGALAATLLLLIIRFRALARPPCISFPSRFYSKFTTLLKSC